MHVQVLASGSRGNALLVRAGELCLLLDAGLPLVELEGRLQQARMPLGKLDAIALTHGHLDHARAAGRLARKSGATLIACQNLLPQRALRAARKQRTLTVGSPLEIRSRRGDEQASLLGVLVPHDAEPTVALRVEHGGRIMGLITDLGHPTDLSRLADAHLLVLEFNHDLELLTSGTYPDALKRRIRGPRGHLSNDEAAQCLETLVNPRLHTVVLAHLSHENNTPELALSSARNALRRLGRGDVRLIVAQQEEIGENLTV